MRDKAKHMSRKQRSEVRLKDKRRKSGTNGNSSAELNGKSQDKLSGSK